MKLIILAVMVLGLTACGAPNYTTGVAEVQLQPVHKATFFKTPLSLKEAAVSTAAGNDVATKEKLKK